MGALFDRLVFLLDSFRDLDEDRRKGAFNAATRSLLPDGTTITTCRNPNSVREGHGLSGLGLGRGNGVAQILLTSSATVGRQTP